MVFKSCNNRKVTTRSPLLLSNTNCCKEGRVECAKTVVLNPWVAIPNDPFFTRGHLRPFFCMSDIYIVIHEQNHSYEVATKIILGLGEVTATWGTVLKGHGIREVENCTIKTSVEDLKI